MPIRRPQGSLLLGRLSRILRQLESLLPGEFFAQGEDNHVDRQATPLRLLLPRNLCRPRPSMRKSRGTTTSITMGAKRERSVAKKTVTSSAMLIPTFAMPAVLAVEARRVAALVV